MRGWEGEYPAWRHPAPRKRCRSHPRRRGAGRSRILARVTPPITPLARGGSRGHQDHRVSQVPRRDARHRAELRARRLRDGRRGRGHARVHRGAPGCRVLRGLPAPRAEQRVLQGGLGPQAGAAHQRRLRSPRRGGGQAGGRAGGQQRRLQFGGGGRAHPDADARGLPQALLAPRQRDHRQVAGGGLRLEPDLRARGQDPRHRGPRHHRQEGRAPGRRLRHEDRLLRHRAPRRGRGGRPRRPVRAPARAAAHRRTSSRSTCRSTRSPGTCSAPASSA